MPINIHGYGPVEMDETDEPVASVYWICILYLSSLSFANPFIVFLVFSRKDIKGSNATLSIVNIVLEMLTDDITLNEPTDRNISQSTQV